MNRDKCMMLIRELRESVRHSHNERLKALVVEMERELSESDSEKTGTHEETQETKVRKSQEDIRRTYLKMVWINARMLTERAKSRSGGKYYSTSLRSNTLVR